MMRGRLAGVVFALLVSAAGVAAAIDAVDPAVERARIATERAEAGRVFDERVAACRERFAVTDCVDEARRERREALTRLRRQESILDEADRRQRAAQRMEAIRNRISAEEAVRPAPPAAAASSPRESRLRVTTRRPRSAESAAAPATAPASGVGEMLPAPPRAGAFRADRRAEEAAHRAAHEARIQAAQARRGAVAQRQAARQAGGKAPSAPLPAASQP